MKKIVFQITVFLALIGSSNAFAISNKEIVKRCFSSAKEMLIEQAQRSGCRIDISQMVVTGVDNRWYNPSKYFWVEAPVANCKFGPNLSMMVQYYRGKCY